MPAFPPERRLDHGVRGGESKVLPYKYGAPHRRPHVQQFNAQAQGVVEREAETGDGAVPAQGPGL